MIDPVHAAWLAGLLEGEGTIVWHAKNSVAVNVFMTDEDVLVACRKRSGLGTVRGPYMTQGRENAKPIWKWSVTRADDVADLLLAVRPWMGARRTARIDQALARIANARGRAARLCNQGHAAWVPTLDGKRYCRECKNERQQERRSLLQERSG